MQDLENSEPATDAVSYIGIDVSKGHHIANYDKQIFAPTYGPFRNIKSQTPIRGGRKPIRIALYMPL